MTNSMFAPATKAATKLRLALEGPSGSGKTYTALRMAHLMGKRIAVIDTENRTASKYIGESPDGVPWAFDVLDMEAPYHPDRYVAAIKNAAAAGYDVIVIDSMAHMWSGTGGMLDLVDANSGQRGNSFDGWRKCKPMERAFWDAITSCKIHLIATFRSKTEWVIEKNAAGKNEPRKIGTKADQRADVEYEFDVAVMFDEDHTGTLIKTRCSAIDGLVFRRPGRELVDPLMAWLSDGSPPPTPAERVATPAQDKAWAALEAAGLLPMAIDRFGPDRREWERDALLAVSKMLADHREAVAEAAKASHAALLEDLTARDWLADAEKFADGPAHDWTPADDTRVREWLSGRTA